MHNFLSVYQKRISSFKQKCDKTDLFQHGISVAIALELRFGNADSIVMHHDIRSLIVRVS